MRRYELVTPFLGGKEGAPAGASPAVACDPPCPPAAACANVRFEGSGEARLAVAREVVFLGGWRPQRSCLRN